MSLYEALANTTVTICTDLPFRVNSLGLWNRSERWTVNATTSLVNFSFPLQNYTMPILEFEMILMFLLTELTYLFLKIFGLPALAAQLVRDGNDQLASGIAGCEMANPCKFVRYDCLTSSKMRSNF
ncbi:unnamed protein product [Prunus armeniaca]|uniref:Uncharacterized protein n=1 Tax=Prunus armeniaca TaxID=36596 RepID=A0A6J5UQQ6_PRUAR|nr:unnamed protein product [Prunus armeniaca]